MGEIKRPQRRSSGVKAYPLFALALALTLAGFWPSFFSNPAGLDAAHIVHGVLATAWMAMLIVQSWLAEHRGLRLHRQVGWASLGLAPALVISGLIMVHAMLKDPQGLPHDLRLTLAFTDLTSLTLFVGLYVAAIVYRRRTPIHARAMGCTVLVALVPAVGRLYAPALGGLTPALNPSYWTVEAALLILIAYDAWRTRRAPTAYPAAPYLATLAAFIAIQFLMFHAPGWPAYLALTRMI